MSFKPEVIADDSGKWCGNALRFATREEAEANVKDLSWRWLSVRDTRVVESDEPVNYRWINGTLVAIDESIVIQVRTNAGRSEVNVNGRLLGICDSDGSVQSLIDGLGANKDAQ